MHKPEPFEILGRQWIVTVDPATNFVRKRPLNPQKDTTEKLFLRNDDARSRMDEYYKSHGWGEAPVPKTELASDRSEVLQERVVGSRLADFESDQELFAQDRAMLLSIERIIVCALDLRKQFGPFQDFLDLPGINNDLPAIKGLIRGLQARYSTNILLPHVNSEAALVDPDFAMVSTRHLYNTVAVIATKPVMFHYMRKFRQQLCDAKAA